ncbi:prephenate dehydrogenase [Alicyclobacillus tolerans]|uniref:Prephenate dehydrogenase n=1 Tax=Alicyclobacillus tolerans TaxID=90970 RepID=A0ABT9LV40_9BACL|nr:MULTISPECIES: prephenate dehydrogenase/arogenate dehydrogenase family protein [Alicyclobacillus]MDP9728144.1 prephenate dehydrogenase [Alicyclobacillus tengchongensis]QRF23369.1 prephenate dehydrogenase/arogenate dehydrogenase family protein [Alicyclobacillus sp. TC]
MNVRVLVVGCGLIGVSLALAWKEKHPDWIFYGLENHPSHRQEAMQLDVFTHVFASWDDMEKTASDRSYTIGLLAVPVEAAISLLPKISAYCEWCIDVCSVKGCICEVAEQLGLRQRFLPTHPMAGKSVGGPQSANAELFLNCSWIVIKNWPALDYFRDFLQGTGAHLVILDNAELHDEWMAVVSHTVHLTSLSVMLAYEDYWVNSGVDPKLLAACTGPAFRDITRLASSPSQFWLETIHQNREPILLHLQRIEDTLKRFKFLLENQDFQGIESELKRSQIARNEWEEWKSHDNFFNPSES